jgi:hypothetical protein
MRLEMWVLGVDGVQVVAGDAVERSTIGSHWNAIQAFLTTGDTSHLEEFEGVQVGEIELETDPDEIEEAWRRRQLDFLEIYL